LSLIGDNKIGYRVKVNYDEEKNKLQLPPPEKSSSCCQSNVKERFGHSRLASSES